MPAIGGELGAERRVVRENADGGISIVRRFAVGADRVERAQRLNQIARAELAGFVPLDAVRLEGTQLEVVERGLPGFTILEALVAVQDQITVAVALALVRDIAHALLALHRLSTTERFVHGDLGPHAVRITARGEVRISGLVGAVGDPADDVADLMRLMRVILEGRARTKEGALLLDRLTALTFTNCHDLAHSIDVYLMRQDPDVVAQRRQQFATDMLAQLSAEATGERTMSNVERVASDTSWGALGPALDYSNFDDEESMPTMGAAELHDLADDSTSTAVDQIPVLAAPSMETVEAAPSPIDLSRSRSNSLGHRLEPPAVLEEIDMKTSESVIDEAVRVGLLGRASTSNLASVPRVGDYHVLASIGRGGMGEIYLARHKSIRELVALKVLSAGDEDDTEALDMLLDEAAIMARIRHPNVLRVVDFGRAQGRYYLATEYLEGRPLVRLMIEAYNQEDGIDDGVIAAVGADVANGLFAAHTATNEIGEPLEVVHRDVSPQNIFVTYRGTSKVIDFGVAKATERVSKTEVGFVKGKAAYMSPEQAEGRALDAKSDVFSLGVCLWEMRAGQRLFKRDSEYDTLLAVQSATIPPPSSMRGKPNPVLDHIILGALERDLHKRTASAQQLARQLIDYATGVGITHRAQVVAALLERLFGAVSSQERALIQQLERGLATREDAEALEALSGVSHKTNVKRITMVAEPESLRDLDDFGTDRPPGESTGEHVMDRVHRIQLERSGSLDSTDPPEEDPWRDEDPPPERETREDIEAYRREESVTPGPMDAGPTRRLDSDIFDGLGIEEPSGDYVPLGGEGPTSDGVGPVVAAKAAAPPSSRRWPIVVGTLALLALVVGFGYVGLRNFVNRGKRMTSNGLAQVAARNDVPRRVASTSTITIADLEPEVARVEDAAAPGAAGVEAPDSVAPDAEPEASADVEAPDALAPNEASPEALADEAAPDEAAPDEVVADVDVPIEPLAAKVVEEAAPERADAKTTQDRTEADAAKPPPDAPRGDKRGDAKEAKEAKEAKDDGKLTIAKLVARLESKGIGVTASEGTYLVDDGAGGSLAFDDAARVTKVATANADGFVVQARSRALTSVGWIGRSDDDAWVVRGLSVNDCPARIQIASRHIAVQYGGQEVQLPLGGGLLTDVELAVPERATRLEVDPLGLSFGESDDASGATHCRTGWWGRRVVLRRLPVGRYTLRWIGEGVAQTATLDVTNEGLVGGKLVRRTGRPAP